MIEQLIDEFGPFGTVSLFFLVMLGVIALFLTLVYARKARRKKVPQEPLRIGVVAPEVPEGAYIYSGKHGMALRKLDDDFMSLADRGGEVYPTEPLHCPAHWFPMAGYVEESGPFSAFFRGQQHPDLLGIRFMRAFRISVGRGDMAIYTPYSDPSLPRPTISPLVLVIGDVSQVLQDEVVEAYVGWCRARSLKEYHDAQREEDRKLLRARASEILGEDVARESDRIALFAIRPPVEDVPTQMQARIRELDQILVELGAGRVGPEPTGQEYDFGTDRHIPTYDVWLTDFNQWSNVLVAIKQHNLTVTNGEGVIF